MAASFDYQINWTEILDIDWSNTEQINNAEIKVERILINQMTNYANQLEQELVQAAENALPAQKALMYNTLYNVARQIFSSVFTKRYGEQSYDIFALENSIILTVGDDLVPYLDYNSTNFVVKSNQRRGRKTYNKNNFDASMEFTMEDVLSDLSMDTMEEYDSEISEGEDIYEDIDKESDQESDEDMESDLIDEAEVESRNNNYIRPQRPEAQREIKEVFQEAKVLTQQQFMKMCMPGSPFMTQVTNIYKYEYNRVLQSQR